MNQKFGKAFNYLRWLPLIYQVKQLSRNTPHNSITYNPTVELLEVVFIRIVAVNSKQFQSYHQKHIYDDNDEEEQLRQYGDDLRSWEFVKL